MTRLGEVLCWAQRRLAEAGIDEARLEARLIARHVTGLETAGLIARAQDPAPPGLAAALDPLLKRRAGREPLAHILGVTDFFGLELYSDARALIPRADSECVVELALECLPDGPARVADLGTGSGCLLLALLSQRGGLTGTGIDASGEAIALARANAEKTGLTARAEFLHLSWAEWQGWGEAALIISNPPYISSAIVETLERDVKDHEPRAALDGGPDGLAAYHEIIGLGVKTMQPGAWLVLEIGYDQREAVSALLTDAGFTDLSHCRDLGGRDRGIAARRD